MIGLTLTQPWATLVAVGIKRYETRSWSTRYRGPMAIHAAKMFPPAAQALCAEEPFRTALGDLTVADLPRGEIVAVVRLLDIVPTDSDGWPPVISGWRPTTDDLVFGDWDPGRWAWALTDIRPLTTPISCKGMLGTWSVSADILAMIHEQLGIEDDDGDPDAGLELRPEIVERLTRPVDRTKMLTADEVRARFHDA